MQAMRSTIRRLAATDLPVSADLEDGYGAEPEQCAETVRLAAAAGLCGCTIEDRTVQYLQASLAQVVPFYRLSTRGAFNAADAEGTEFAAARLGAGAAELRDMIVDAWRSSATWVVGFPLIKVQDIESGAVQLTRTSYASD